MELKDVIHGRRSIRRYIDKPVAQQDIEDIMELGRHRVLIYSSGTL